MISWLIDRLHEHHWYPTGRVDYAFSVREVACEHTFCTRRRWEPVDPRELF